MNAPALRAALQRLLGLIPTLFLVSMVAFWGLSFALGPQGSSTAGPHGLPIFFNPMPAGVGQRALHHAEQIARGVNEPQVYGELVALGAAALPSLMPHLDSLPPQERARVAVALTPLAARMGIDEGEDLTNAEAAAAFWNRYWADHAIDFRAQVVERAVARLVSRPTAARRAEVRQLDTFALPAVMAALGHTQDPSALSQLVSLAAHISGQPWSLRETDTDVKAREQVLECQRWWRAQGGRFSSYEGNSRLVGMLQETQYGHWLLGVLSGQGLEQNRERWSPLPTLTLIASGILGGYFMGPLLAAWTTTLTRGRKSVLVISAVLASIPAAALASWWGHSAGSSQLLAVSAMLLLGASLLCIYQYQATRDACSYDFVQTRRAFGASRLLSALGALHSSSLISAAHLANHGASLFTAACVVEWAFDWRGLGWLTLQAMHARDVATLTWVAVLCTLASGVLQITSSLIMSRFERALRAVT